MTIRYLHTMVRVLDLEKSIAFFRLLGLEETKRWDNEGGRFTLVFMLSLIHIYITPMVETPAR